MFRKKVTGLYTAYLPKLIKDYMKKGLSLVINVKNEEKNIAECIKSARAIVDEVIVADMHSTDKTVEIAKKLGATVITVKDFGYVEPARNKAIEKASYSWILVLDADERLTLQLAKTLRKIVDENKYDIVWISKMNYILGKWMQHGAWWPIAVVCMFRNGNVKWTNKIHEYLKIRGKEYYLPIEKKYAIIHKTHSSVKELAESIFRYASKESKIKMEMVDTPEKIMAFIKSDFNRRYIQNKGYLDGLHGFFINKFMEYYKFLELAIFWEKNSYRLPIDNTELAKYVMEYKDDSQLRHENEQFRKQVKRLQGLLLNIQSSKFYKVWRRYINIRDRLKFFGKR